MKAASPICESIKILLLLTFVVAAGCSRLPNLPSKDNIPFVHRVDVQQGNVVTQDMLAQLRRGMERSKVRYIMGTPLVADTFHANRWDYIYTFQKGSGRREQRRVSLYFEDDLLDRVEGDVVAALGRLEFERGRSEMVEVPGFVEQTLFGKLKGKVWSDDEESDGVQARTDEESGTGEEATDPEDEFAEEDQEDEEVVIPEDAPTKREKKGFFGRLLEKVGLNDDKSGGEYKGEDPSYRDPTDTGQSGPLKRD